MADDAAAGPVRGFGWRPSLPDARDILADTSEIPIRPEVDPRGEYMTAVYDQGQIGSCTADDTSSPLFRTDPRKDTDWPPQHWILQDRYKAVPRSLTAFKRVLSNRQTIAFGFSVPEGFQSARMARTGIMELPGDTPLIEHAGHEVLAVGYLKSEPHYCLVRNSWGADWGMDGYFLMPWVWLLETSLSSDFRTIYSPLR